MLPGLEYASLAWADPLENPNVQQVVGIVEGRRAEHSRAPVGHGLGQASLAVEPRVFTSGVLARASWLALHFVAVRLILENGNLFCWFWEAFDWRGSVEWRATYRPDRGEAHRDGGFGSRSPTRRSASTVGDNSGSAGASGPALAVGAATSPGSAAFRRPRLLAARLGASRAAVPSSSTRPAGAVLASGSTSANGWAACPRRRSHGNRGSSGACEGREGIDGRQRA